MRLLEEDLLALAKAKSLFSANFLALPVVLETGPWLVLVFPPSKMAILALTKPLWSLGSLEGLLVSSKTWSLDLTIPSQICNLCWVCCWLEYGKLFDWGRLCSLSLDSFSTTLLIRLSIFCDLGKRSSAAAASAVADNSSFLEARPKSIKEICI